MHRECVVQHVALAGWLWRFFQSLGEAAEFLGLIAIVGPQVLPAVGLFDFVGQAVSTIQADGE